MPYRLKLLRDIEKQLRKIPTADRERIVNTMRSLASEPRPTGSTPLVDNLLRLREGHYRIVYAVFDAELVVLVCKVARRPEATYRDIHALLRRAKDLLDST